MALIGVPKKTAPKRPLAAAKPRSLGGARGKLAVRKVVATKTVAVKVAAKKASARTPVVRKAIAKKMATRILSAPKGARTLTHRKIKQAVERVFEDRYGTDG